MLLVIKRTGDIQMNDLNDTAKHHHLQYSVEQLKTMCSSYYRRVMRLKNWRTVEIQLL